MNDDILTRLKATTKINGAYPRDIEDAIKEISELHRFKKELLWHLNPFDDGDFFLTKESYDELFVSDQKAT